MATKYGGYMGKVLDINLSTGLIGTYEVSDEDRAKFLGGKALSAKILWDELEPGIDPLSPDNMLIFMTGPLNGSNAPCSSRYNVTTKNVLTGGIASANSGGDFGLRLKSAGYDGLIVRGAADKPVRIDIDDDDVTIGDATALWGMNAEEVQEGFDRAVGTMAIGPAGENLVRFAAILCGERAFGRCGVGAVMGSKRLKLVTAKGTKRPTLHNRDAAKEAIKNWVKILKKHSVTGTHLPTYGTAGLVSATHATHTLGTRNFQRGTYDKYHTISGEYLAEKKLVKNTGCTSCPIRCGRIVEYKGKKIKGPEFETLGLMGANLENSDMDKIIEWNYLCDVHGMDTMSCGSTLACAMELAEDGKLNGSGLAFGKTDAVSDVIDKIARREGVGDDLAEGSMRLAAKYGKPDAAMHSKGLELAAYEPRGAVGHGLGYATANRGGCHINGGYLVYLEALGQVTMNPLTTKGKAELTVMQQNLMEAISAAGNCIFTSYAVIPDIPARFYNPHGFSGKLVDKILQGSRFVLKGQGKQKPNAIPFHPPMLPYTRVISYVTGMNVRMSEFNAFGERGFTMERLFNLREGLDAADDKLPPRLMSEPQIPDNPDSCVPVPTMKPRYYLVRDWDEGGVPKDRLLKKLGMEFAIEEMEKLRANPSQYRARYEAMRSDEDRVLREVLKTNRALAG